MPRQRQRFDDDQAHQRAVSHLVQLAGGGRSYDVHWDPDHHLQGHVTVRGEHFVLIAARDDEHTPLVLSEAEWDALRRGCLTTA